MIVKTLISVVILLMVAGSCTEHENKTQSELDNRINPPGNKIDTLMSDGQPVYFTGTSGIYKDFDLFSFTAIPFKMNDPVLYPYIKVDSSGDAVDVKFFWEPGIVQYITFTITNGLWEVRKPSFQKDYAGGRKTIDRIIILKDVAVLKMLGFYDWEKRAGFTSDISSYSRFTKSGNCIKEENYREIDISEKNLRNLYLWDSTSYKKSSFHPSYKLDVCIDDKKAAITGFETSGNSPGEVDWYESTIMHNNNSSSFFYYLFKWW